MRPLLSSVAATLLFLLVIAFPNSPQAFSVCNFDCASNCQLDTDVRCCANALLCPQGTGAGRVELQGGADLNLNGKKLECFCGQTTCNGGTNNNALCSTNSQCPGGTCTDSTGCTSCSGPAVTMTGNSSVVRNTAPGTGGIIGPWTYGVSCAGKSASEVSGILVAGIRRFAIDQCAHADNNTVIAGAQDGSLSQIGIIGGAIANSDTITSNYVSGFDSYGIIVSGTKTAEVARNIVRGKFSWPDYSDYGIYDSSTAATITGNIFTGPPDSLNFLINNSGNPGNYCEESLDGGVIDACSSCRLGGSCVDPEAAPPFVFGQ